MRRAWIAVALLGCLALTACGESLDDVRRDAAFAKACTDGGGRVGYDGFNNIYCSFMKGNS